MHNNLILFSTYFSVDACPHLRLKQNKSHMYVPNTKVNFSDEN